MDAGLLAQYVVITLAVVLSAWFVLKRQFPGAVRKLRLAMAVPLVREGRPAWMRRLGKRIAPPVKSIGGSCGGCDGCD
ncbi:hypothetical protein N800_01770 [Lysobacter daejeonensis GH1-9]|uniref:Uncharacterized protein n=1 Tax=Lysobacter daejeonensis GH1-9 TaxID=1385517 RepID=A0A0A0EV66_9GAMM|nr:DUF6587 family protein [Lysobacter daejeonensis]KGM54816.1 hypothetical protein N800_01770 [Lysobacter daejeonensis GH1-9]